MLRCVLAIPTLMIIFIMNIWMDVEFCQLHFRHLLKWSCDFYPSLEKATHSSTLAKKSHGRRSLVSMGSQRVGHDWATLLYFTTYFVIMMYHNDWFANIEPSLGPLNKFHLIMVYDPFNGMLDLVCYIVLRIFCIYVHQWYWAVIFFLSFFFFLVLVSEWWWLHRMSLGVFLPLQFLE